MVKQHFVTASLAALLVATLPGCLILPPPLPIRDIMTATVSGISELSSMTQESSISKGRTRLPVKEVCILWNDTVYIAEFVPTVQQRLRKYGISSAVYSPGTEPAGCSSVMEYQAMRAWDGGAFNRDGMPYMSYASITLRRGGTVLSTASYQMGGMKLDKWASNESKLYTLVDNLLFKY